MKVILRYDKSKTNVTPYSFFYPKKGYTTEGFNYPNYMRIRRALENLGIEVLDHEQEEQEKE